MKIDICSRKTAEALLEAGFPKNTAVISFYDPPSKRMKEVLPPVDYKGKADRIFYLSLHDIDTDVLPDYGLPILFARHMTTVLTFSANVNMDKAEVLSAPPP